MYGSDLGHTFLRDAPSSGVRSCLHEKLSIKFPSIPMASISRRLLLYSRRYPNRISTQCSSPRCAPQWQRQLSTTRSFRIDEPTKESSATAAAADASSKSLEEGTESSTPASKTAEQLRKLVEDLKALDPEVVQDALRKGKSG